VQRVTAVLSQARDLVCRRPYHLALGSLACGLGCSTVASDLRAVAGAAALVALASLRAAPIGLLCASLFLAGGIAGGQRLHSIDGPGHALRSESRLAGRAILLEKPRPTRFGSQALVRVATGRGRGARLLARGERGVRWPTGAEVGAELALDGRVRRPRSRRGERFDYGAYLRRRGVAAELWVTSIRATGRRRGGVAGALDAMRGRAERALSAGLTPRKAALVRGMVLGQDELIDEATRDDWRAAGLAHLLAVSGQNVMLLAALAVPLLAAARLPTWTRAAAVAALIALYVPLAGAGPSLQRAGVMGAASLAAMGLARPASRWYALLLAACVTLALNPRAGVDPGWQLSFAAVAGILLLTPGLRRALSRALPRPAAEGVAVTVAATLATAPLLAYHFGSVPLVGLPANVLALPLVAPVMWLGMIRVALGQLIPASPAAEPLASAIGSVAGAVNDLAGIALAPLVAALAALARAFADLPGGQLALPALTPALVAGAYVAMAVLVLAAARLTRGAEPTLQAAAAAWRRRPRGHRVSAVCALSGAGALLLASAFTSPSPPRALTVSFLDIGQGDATLIQDGAGASALFDGGPPEARVYRRLRAVGVSRLDLVVSTHQSRDHQGGLHEVLQRIPTRLVVENGYGTTDPDYRRLIAEANARGVQRIAARGGETLRVGRLTIQILGPPSRALGEPPPEDPNPIGVAAIVSEGSFDLWLSADAESDAILHYPLRKVEAMKVSHHGSRDPGLPQVLRRLRPQVAAIEVGAHNGYGHPTPETLAALKAAVPHVYRTDRDGTVTLTVDDDRMSVDTHR